MTNSWGHKKILDKYNFGITIDLQHCYDNDRSMNLSLNFQNIFKDRIKEYHISWYEKSRPHLSLFKTKQDIIINSLLYKDKPIIIESCFDKLWDHIKELNYILENLNK